MSKRLKTGDIVQLKSGGPEMTVRGYHLSNDKESDTEVVCEWFQEDLKQAVFHEDTLMKISLTRTNLMNKM